MKSLFSFLFLFVTITSYSQTKFLIPYREGKLWGYADTNLNIVVKPKYEQVSLFNNGYAPVVKEKLVGIMDSHGREIISPQYDELINCCYTVLAVSKNNQKGLIDLPTGKIILPVKYNSLSNVFGDIYLVTGQDSLMGVFDAKIEKWLLRREYVLLSEQFPWYIAKGKDSIIHFMIDSGKLVRGTAPDLTTVQNEQVSSDETPAIDELQETMTVRILPGYDSQSDVIGTDEIFIVSKSGKMGIYSEKFKKETIPLLYDKVEQVPNSNDQPLFIVTKDGKDGMINAHNSIITPLVYDRITSTDSSASSNIYIVKNSGRFGLIKGNKQILPPTYDTIFGWKSGRDGFLLYEGTRRGAYIYSTESSIHDIYIPAKYDAILSTLTLHPNNFNPAIPYLLEKKQAKLFFQIYNKGGLDYIDSNGKEFFKD